MLTKDETILAPPIEHILAHELKVSSRQVWAAIKLLDNGATVPFIARYRKEATGGLTDTHLRMLSDRLEYLRELESRRADILESIQSQGKLADSLRAAIQKAATKAELEDLYLPFRPKKESRAQAAKDKGLGPLAEAILADPSVDPQSTAQAFVNPDKAVPDIPAALSGARDILVERFAEDAVLSGTLREKFWKEGWIVSRKSEAAALSEDSEKFLDYFSFRESFLKIPSHRTLAILRGRKENVLQVSLQTDGYSDLNHDTKSLDAEYVHAIALRFGIEFKKRLADLWLLETVRFAWKYKIRLRLELDLLARLKEAAEAEAIKVFAENLKNLLLAAPAGPRVTLGLDPGFRTGVKVAVVDRSGQVLEVAVVYPHEPQTDWAGSKKKLSALIQKHSVELIAIGNGTASRETDKLASEVIRENPGASVQKIVVSEAGASVYSASALASQELPSLDVTYRGAVSIARRLQDPLAELVKIDPKSIGVGQYQHDVNQLRLSKMLHAVVEDCVNAVGVDANTASVSILTYVAGLNKRVAESLVARRSSKGLFKNRLEFLTIPDFGPKSFEQAAGFLRIHEGENPLDGSAVHPESYPLVQKILLKIEKNLEEIMGNGAALSALDPEAFSDETYGVPTVTDVLKELEKPGRDPRPEFITAVFREDVAQMQDLKPGMILEGVVTNVANFGAFVDIGVHQDGLVHISELSESFVQDPHAVVKTGQVVRVKVMEIDLSRRRVALSMRMSSNAAGKGMR